MCLCVCVCACLLFGDMLIRCKCRTRAGSVGRHADLEVLSGDRMTGGANLLRFMPMVRQVLVRQVQPQPKRQDDGPVGG